MQIALRERGKAVIVDVKGQITFETVSGLAEQIQTALEQTELAVLVNLQGVEYVDSSGIAVLVEGLKSSQAARKAFGLVGLTRAVRNVIELVRLDTILQIFNDEEEALRELASPLSHSKQNEE